MGLSQSAPSASHPHLLSSPSSSAPHPPTPPPPPPPSNPLPLFSSYLFQLLRSLSFGIHSSTFASFLLPSPLWDSLYSLRYYPHSIQNICSFFSSLLREDEGTNLLYIEIILSFRNQNVFFSPSPSPPLSFATKMFLSRILSCELVFKLLTNGEFIKFICDRNAILDIQNALSTSSPSPIPSFPSPSFPSFLSSLSYSLRVLDISRVQNLFSHLFPSKEEALKMIFRDIDRLLSGMTGRNHVELSLTFDHFVILKFIFHLFSLPSVRSLLLDKRFHSLYCSFTFFNQLQIKLIIYGDKVKDLMRAMEGEQQEETQAYSPSVSPSPPSTSTVHSQSHTHAPPPPHLPPFCLPLQLFGKILHSLANDPFVLLFLTLLKDHNSLIGEIIGVIFEKLIKCWLSPSEYIENIWNQRENSMKSNGENKNISNSIPIFPSFPSSSPRRLPLPSSVVDALLSLQDPNYRPKISTSVSPYEIQPNWKILFESFKTLREEEDQQGNHSFNMDIQFTHVEPLVVSLITFLYFYTHKDKMPTWNTTHSHPQTLPSSSFTPYSFSDSLLNSQFYLDFSAFLSKYHYGGGGGAVGANPTSSTSSSTSSPSPSSPSSNFSPFSDCVSSPFFSPFVSSLSKSSPFITLCIFHTIDTLLKFDEMDKEMSQMDSQMTIRISNEMRQKEERRNNSIANQQIQSEKKESSPVINQSGNGSGSGGWGLNPFAWIFSFGRWIFPPTPLKTQKIDKTLGNNSPTNTFDSENSEIQYDHEDNNTLPSHPPSPCHLSIYRIHPFSPSLSRLFYIFQQWSRHVLNGEIDIERFFTPTIIGSAADFILSYYLMTMKRKEEEKITLTLRDKKQVEFVKNWLTAKDGTHDQGPHDDISRFLSVPLNAFMVSRLSSSDRSECIAHSLFTIITSTNISNVFMSSDKLWNFAFSADGNGGWVKKNLLKVKREKSTRGHNKEEGKQTSGLITSYPYLPLVTELSPHLPLLLSDSNIFPILRLFTFLSFTQLNKFLGTETMHQISVPKDLCPKLQVVYQHFTAPLSHIGMIKTIETNSTLRDQYKNIIIFMTQRNMVELIILIEQMVGDPQSSSSSSAPTPPPFSFSSPPPLTLRSHMQNHLFSKVCHLIDSAKLFDFIFQNSLAAAHFIAFVIAKYVWPYEYTAHPSSFSSPSPYPSSFDASVIVRDCALDLLISLSSLFGLHDQFKISSIRSTAWDTAELGLQFVAEEKQEEKNVKLPSAPDDNNHKTPNSLSPLPSSFDVKISRFLSVEREKFLFHQNHWERILSSSRILNIFQQNPNSITALHTALLSFVALFITSPFVQMIFQSSELWNLLGDGEFLAKISQFNLAISPLLSQRHSLECLSHPPRAVSLTLTQRAQLTSLKMKIRFLRIQFFHSILSMEKVKFLMDKIQSKEGAKMAAELGKEFYSLMKEKRGRDIIENIKENIRIQCEQKQTAETPQTESDSATSDQNSKRFRLLTVLLLPQTESLLCSETFWNFLFSPSTLMGNMSKVFTGKGKGKNESANDPLGWGMGGKMTQWKEKIKTKIKETGQIQGQTDSKSMDSSPHSFWRPFMALFNAVFDLAFGLQRVKRKAKL